MPRHERATQALGKPVYVESWVPPGKVFQQNKGTDDEIVFLSSDREASELADKLEEAHRVADDFRATLDAIGENLGNSS